MGWNSLCQITYWPSPSKEERVEGRRGNAACEGKARVFKSSEFVDNLKTLCVHNAIVFLYELLFIESRKILPRNFFWIL